MLSPNFDVSSPNLGVLIPNFGVLIPNSKKKFAIFRNFFRAPIPGLPIPGSGG